MSKNWALDIHNMHAYYGFHDIIDNMTKDELKEFLQFRIRFLKEELQEMVDGHDNPEDVVDALIDLIVVAIGTLDAFQVNAHKAWDEVLRANMSKKVGVNGKRSGIIKFPDLIKGEDWVPPSHVNNHGTLPTGN